MWSLGPSAKCKLSALHNRFEFFAGLECQPITPLIYANCSCPSTSWTCVKDSLILPLWTQGIMYVPIHCHCQNQSYSIPEIMERVLNGQKFGVPAPQSRNYTNHHLYSIFKSTCEYSVASNITYKTSEEIEWRLLFQTTIKWKYQTNKIWKCFYYFI